MREFLGVFGLEKGKRTTTYVRFENKNNNKITHWMIFVNGVYAFCLKGSVKQKEHLVIGNYCPACDVISKLQRESRDDNCRQPSF